MEQLNITKPKQELQLLTTYQEAIDTNIICSMTDIHGTILYINEKFCKISKYSESELLGQTHRLVNSGFHPKHFFKQMWETLLNGKAWHGEIKNKAKDGSYYWVDTSIVPVRDKNENIVRFLSLRILITKRKEAEEELLKLNESLEELVRLRTSELTIRNNDLIESIRYAKRIQQSKLPPKKEIYAVFPRSFILFKPKEIVSGDFYFFHKKEHCAFIASADCTGHGVPGSLMSILGSEKLEEAILHSSDTSEILNLLNKGIKTSLRQSDEDGSIRDGMDIALCGVDVENRIINYAGANRPLWIIRKGQNVIEEIKATKRAIGGLTDTDQHFESHTIQLQQGDTFYIFTDGYADTFGGREGKKLMTKKFKEVLIGIQIMEMPQQKKCLDDFIESWKGDDEQIDDILVIGIRL